MDASPCLCRAFDVFRADLSSNMAPLFRRYWGLSLSTQHSLCLVVGPQIRLSSDQDNGCSVTEVRYLWEPL